MAKNKNMIWDKIINYVYSQLEKKPLGCILLRGVKISTQEVKLKTTLLKMYIAVFF